MSINDDSPGEVIAQALSGSPNTIVDSSIWVMESLANVLIVILGEQCFETLLLRSADVVTQRFRWFTYDRYSRCSDPEFELFRRCLENQEAEQAHLASHLLLSTFIDNLGVIIGNHLSMTLLHLALQGAARHSSGAKLRPGP